MALELTEDEQARGYVNLALLPEQAEKVEEILAARGLTLSGPTIFDRAEGPVRCISLSNEQAARLLVENGVA